MSRMLLVDGTNIVMRYAHAMAPDFVREPENPAAKESIERVANACVRAILECADVSGSTHAIIAFDGPNSWRKHRYPEYKASRTVSTRVWSDALRSTCEASGLRTVTCEQFEADDVIATLEHRIRESGRKTAVLSGDSDLLVLASDSCNVYQFGRKEEPRYAWREQRWICEKYGIASAQRLRDYKAIVGESGESLSGISGYGPKKALQLLERFGTADALLQSVALTDANREQLALMLELVTLRTDVPITAISPAECRIANP
jgi:DNA polymerase-1